MLGITAMGEEKVVCRSGSGMSECLGRQKAAGQRMVGATKSKKGKGKEFLSTVQGRSCPGKEGQVKKPHSPSCSFHCPPPCLSVPAQPASHLTKMPVCLEAGGGGGVLPAFLLPSSINPSRGEKVPLHACRHGHKPKPQNCTCLSMPKFGSSHRENQHKNNTCPHCLVAWYGRWWG